MKTWFTIIVFFLFPIFVYAQNFQIDKPPFSIDSLKKVLPSLRDSARIDYLNELSRSYFEIELPEMFDTAWLYANQSYQEAYSINYTKGLGDACLRKGLLAQWHHFNTREMATYFSEAISWYEKISDHNGLGHAWLGKGRAARGLGTVVINPASAVDEAWKAFEQSAFHFRKTGNRIMLAELTDHFGLVYNEKGDFEKYFEQIKQGLREKKAIGDNRGIIWSFYRLAYVYLTVGDYETALDYLRQSYGQAHSQSIPWNIGRTMGNVFLSLKNYDSALYYYRDLLIHLPGDSHAMASIGKLFLDKKEYDSALYYLQTAIFTLKKNHDDGRVMKAMVDMGDSYLGRKEYSKAMHQARKCLTIAERWNAKDMIQQACEINWKAFEALKQNDSAYYYLRKFVPLKDSLGNARLRLQNIQKLTLYKVEAKQEQQQARIDMLHKDNQIKQTQLQKESFTKKILVGGLAAFILLGIILLRNIVLKRKNEKHRRELAENELQIQKLESERAKAELQQQATELEMHALRAQMNPHFIFNCLSSINRFILKNEPEMASDYLTKFSRLIRMVLNNSKNSLIILEDELEMLRLYLDLERLRFKNAFDYSISFYNHFDISSIFIPPLLLQPFAENAIWHGLMHKEGHGYLEITLELENNMLNCYITDNGVGRKKAEALKSKSVEKQKSMGMQITAERLALLNKDIEQTIFNVEDLTDAEGQAAGTRVTVKIRYKDSVEESIAH